MNRPPLIGRKADGHSRELEPTGDVPGKHLDRASGVGRQEDVTRQIEQARDLVPSGDCIAGAILRGCGEIAGDS